MSTIGTFGTFTTARMGIYAAQMGLSVTGNNIANINTEGYTRQKLEQEALKPGGSDRYYSQFGSRVGQGALVTGLSQTRDKYLDIRYRTEASNTAAADQKLALMNNIASILDEVGCGDEENGLIYANLSELESALRNLSDYAGQDIYDAQVRSAASSLTTLFNNYAKRLDEVADNTVTNFKDDVKKVNEILDSIRELNVAIRKSDIHGDPALEMRDDRNLLLDKLSEYMKISVSYSMEEITAGVYVEKLNVRLDNDNTDNIAKNSDTDRTVLVDGIYTANLYCQPQKAEAGVDADGNQLYVSKYDPEKTTTDLSAAAEDYSGNFNMTVGPLRDLKGRIMLDKKGNPTQPVELLDNDLHGSLQATREMLTEAGEFSTADTLATVDPRAAVKRGIPYYQKTLDLLARQLAAKFNEANNGYMTDQDGNYITEDGKLVMDADGKPINQYTATAAQKELLETLGNLSETIDATEKNLATADDELKTATDELTAAQAALTTAETALEAAKKDLDDAAADADIDALNAAVAAAQTTFDAAQTAVDDAKTAEAEKQTAFDELTEKLKELKETAGKNVDNMPKKMGGNLFSNSGDGNDDTEITARNISVALDWSDGTTRIVCSYVRHEEGEAAVGQVAGDKGALKDKPTTDNDNVLHMVAIMDKSYTYNPQDVVADAVSNKLFVGDFSEMLNNMANILADDQRSTGVDVQTYYTSATDLDASRMNVSSVDLNDEAMNLMQYQKSYQAACRLMTTIDQVIDKLINGTGVVGL